MGALPGKGAKHKIKAMRRKDGNGDGGNVARAEARALGDRAPEVRRAAAAFAALAMGGHGGRAVGVRRGAPGSVEGAASPVGPGRRGEVAA